VDTETKLYRPKRLKKTCFINIANVFSQFPTTYMIFLFQKVQ